MSVSEAAPYAIERRYRVWIEKTPGTVVETGVRSIGVSYVLGVIALGTVASLPVVSRATHIPALLVVLLLLIHGVWTAAVALWIEPAAKLSKTAFRCMTLGNLFVGEGVVLALAAATGSTGSPLWSLPVVYSCMNGAISESRPSYVLLAVHSLGPLATMPWLLMQGARGSTAVAICIVVGTISGLGYHAIAIRTANLRALRVKEQQELEAARRQLAQLERERLARDLHDCVGSALSTVSLYGDLIDSNLQAPASLQRFTDSLREAADSGIRELRSVLDLISENGGALGDLVEILEQVVLRYSSVPGLQIEFVKGDVPASSVDAPTRLCIVRMCQEALSNAMKHASARNVRVEFFLGESSIGVKVKDDGKGFDPTCVNGGRGLASMRARCNELGGSLSLKTAHNQGCEVTILLPYPTVTPGATSVPS